MMRRAPRTPNPGSILVCNCRGSGVGVALAEVVFEGAELVDDAVGVTVTLKMVGTTVGRVTSDVPECVVNELVKEEVVRESDSEVEEVAEGDGLAGEDELCATTGPPRRRTNAATAAHDAGCRGYMADGRKGEWWTGGNERR